MIRAEDLLGKRKKKEEVVQEDNFAQRNIKRGEEFAINSRRELYEALQKLNG
jgi:hypothetical protein